MIKSIQLAHYFNFKALPNGTKLFLKTTDDVVREVKIIGGEFAIQENYTTLLYKYKIAGLSGTYIGTQKSIHYNGISGRLYPYMECITKGLNVDFSHLYVEYDFCKIFSRYIMKTGDCKKNGQNYPFLYMCGTFDSYAQFRATKLGKNGQVYQEDVFFNLWFDEYGWHGEIPAIDNGDAYHNAEEALSHYKPKIVTFDNEPEQEEPKDKDVTITIKIKESDVAKIKKLCEIVK